MHTLFLKMITIASDKQEFLRAYQTIKMLLHYGQVDWLRGDLVNMNCLDGFSIIYQN